MPKLINVGESVECNRSHITVRKLSDNPIQVKFDGFAKRLFKYKSSIRSIVKIEEQLEPNEKGEIKPIICDSSNVGIDDFLEAEIVEIYSEKRISTDVLSNFSHVHGIQGSVVNAFTYAKIMTPWRFTLVGTLSDPKLLKKGA